MLPEMHSTAKTNQKAIAECNAGQKEPIKSYADNSRSAKEICFKLGDTALLKQPKEKKFSAPYYPQPFVVGKRKGTMITAKLNDSQTVI